LAKRRPASAFPLDRPRKADIGGETPLLTASDRMGPAMTEFDASLVFLATSRATARRRLKSPMGVATSGARLSRGRFSARFDGKEEARRAA
jgi:hypothetical protein